MKSASKIIGGVIILVIIGAIFFRPDLDELARGHPQGRASGGGARLIGNPSPTGEKPGGGPVEVGQMNGPFLTVAVRDLPPYEENFPNLDREITPRNDHGFIGPNIQMPPHGNPLVDLQRDAPDPAPDAFGTPLLNFAGYTSSSSPPDDTGDVGPNHYVQGDNSGSGSLITVYDKSGSQLAQFLMESLAPTSPCDSGYCDPIVQYDQLADRWMISEFEYSSGNHLCVYVSQTPDPTGAWYAYDFDPAGTMQDYHKYGVWWDGYYVGVNNGGYVHALEREQMLLGQPASYQSFDIGTLPGWGFQLTLPATVEGPNAPPSGAPALFMRPVDTEIHTGWSCPSEPCDLMDVWELDVDWNTPTNSTLTQLPSVQIAEYDHTLCGTSGNWDCMPQPGTNQQIDPIREPLHFPLQYRNFDTHETLVGCFAEDVDGTDHAGVHWFEMRNEGSGWTMYQEGVLGGEAGVHRSVCSAAMDGSGNIAVGYTRTGADAPYYPSIYYAGRLDTDPLGTMPYYEYVIWDATDSKTDNERWGDYAGIGVDPSDDCTFWFTTEYGGNGQTRIAAFKFDECGNPDFAIDATPDSLDVCAPDDAVYTVDVASLNGFGDAVTLSSSGRPAGTTESFSPNPINPPGSSTWTIGDTGAATPGTYSIDVIGTSSGPGPHQDTVELNLYAALPGTANLLSPADGSIGVTTSPSYDWSDVTDAATYDIEVATDPGFSNIVDSATGLTDSYYSGTSLNPNTVYYWRVRTNNACGNILSVVWAFRTEATSCTIYGPGDTGTIQDARGINPRTTSFYLNNVPSHTIIDVNVIDLQGTHTYVGNLEFNLESPTGTRVQLINRMCSSAADFDKDLDDEAANPVACPLDDGTTQQPGQAVSAYDGENSQGIWTLDITDHARGDSGNLAAWNLEICYGSEATSADYSDLTSGYGIAWHTGNGEIRLGPGWDADDAFSLGSDDATDDGVTISNFSAGQNATVRVNVQGTPTNGRWLRLWFDWDNDGVFDDTDLEYDNAVNDGDNDITVAVPTGLSDPVYYRARLYDSGGAPMALDPNSYGEAAGGEVEDGQSPSPTPVELAGFEAAAHGNDVRVTWETASEINLMGFNLYRSTTAEGPYVQVNDKLIPAENPGAPFGATYTWWDRGLRLGRTYYYKLEQVDTSGGTTMHGPIWVRLRQRIPPH